MHIDYRNVQKLPQQIKDLLQKTTKKEVKVSYDGLLKIRMYNEPLPNMHPYSPPETKQGWRIPVGIARTEFVKHDFDQIPHMVVAGTTRYGKSVFLKNVITTLIHRQPTNTQFTLVDLKGALTFNRFANLTQTHAVATDVDETLSSLQFIQHDMKQRTSAETDVSNPSLVFISVIARFFYPVPLCVSTKISIHLHPRGISDAREQVIGYRLHRLCVAPSGVPSNFPRLGSGSPYLTDLGFP